MAAELQLDKYKNRHSFGSKVGRVLWNMTWLLCARWTPDHGKLFNCWRIALIRLFGGHIGRHCVVKSSCEIWQPWKLKLGEYVALSEHVICYSVDAITIGNHATVSRDTFLCCASHDISSPNMELTYAPIVIGDNAWIAARAIVLPGRTIGAGAVVAAGSVVVKDVAPWTVVGGNPAVVVGKRQLEKGAS